jgi:hypothetical protein
MKASTQEMIDAKGRERAYSFQRSWGGCWRNQNFGEFERSGR